MVSLFSSSPQMKNTSAVYLFRYCFANCNCFFADVFEMDILTIFSRNRLFRWSKSNFWNQCKTFEFLLRKTLKLFLIIFTNLYGDATHVQRYVHVQRNHGIYWYCQIASKLIMFRWCSRAWLATYWAKNRNSNSLKRQILMMNVEKRIQSKINDKKIQARNFVKMEWQVPENLSESE